MVDAATKIVKSGGYVTLSIRSLALALGVSPMSLYRHVRDKDDLLDEVVDRLLTRAWRPRAPLIDWKAWVSEAADRLRRFLVSQPAALHVYLRHPVVSPAAVARMHAMVDVLRLNLGDEAAARDAYAAIHTYTIGFAALEASRAGWLLGSDDDGDELARQLASYTSPEQFASGLHFLLEGIEHGERRSQRRSEVNG